MQVQRCKCCLGVASFQAWNCCSTVLEKMQDLPCMMPITREHLQICLSAFQVLSPFGALGAFKAKAFSPKLFPKFGKNGTRVQKAWYASGYHPKVILSSVSEECSSLMNALKFDQRNCLICSLPWPSQHGCLHSGALERLLVATGYSIGQIWPCMLHVMLAGI